MPYFNPGVMSIGGESDTVILNAVPVQPGNGGNQGSNSNLSDKRKLPIAISVPGNIITEEAEGSEASIVEELFEDLSIFELMELETAD